MSEKHVKLTGDWEKLEVAVNPKIWAEVFNDYVIIGLKKLGLAFRRLAREMIRDKMYAPNAAYTIAAWYEKGGDDARAKAAERAAEEGVSLSDAMASGKVPLIDEGDLIKSITSQLRDDGLYLGANKTVDGRNVAAELHSGATKKINGRTVVIPPRPYISAPLMTEKFGNLVKKHIHTALKKAFNG